MDLLEREQARLIHEATLRADAERRSAAFLLSQDVGVIAFALTPLVPHADRFFGALTAPVALALSVPPLLAAHVSALLYRAHGAEARVYRVAEAVESFALYMNVLWFIWLSGIERSPFWILSPLTAAFWATKKPFASRFYATIIALAHGLLAALYFAHARRDGALLALAVGAATYVTYHSIARNGRANVAVEAERNALAAQLVETNLAQERERIAEVLRTRTGSEIAHLVAELRSVEHADWQQVLRDLGDLASAAYEPRAATTLGEALQRIDEKCRVLSPRLEYASELAGDADAALPASTAHAFLRVAQELGRNAIVHGQARKVRVVLAADAHAFSLAVNDDGVGLSPDVFARGTGGIANAKRWIGDLGGTIAPVACKVGTTLQARVPRR